MSQSRASRASTDPLLRLVAAVLGRRRIASGGIAGWLNRLKASDRDARYAAALNELFASRFPSLPADCGQDLEPGVNETEEWRHWVSHETTQDQRRIERYLRSLSLKGKRILHVGVGNSGFARSFAGKCDSIRGITISDEEVRHAESLNIRNYECVKQNKYADLAITGNYDFIIDNNPTGFACCRRHFGFMIRNYRTALNQDGLLLTDKVGLSWISGKQPRDSRWSFSFQDWDAVARTQEFECVAIDGFLVAWARPGVKIPRLKHYALQCLRTPADLLLVAERTIARKFRNRLMRLRRR